MGSHWKPFFDDFRELAARLPKILPESSSSACYGEFFPAPMQEHGSWVSVEDLFWPLPRHGLMMTLRKDTDAAQLVSLFPNTGEGIEVTLRLKRVSVWESGVEAQVHAVWVGSDVEIHPRVG